MMSASAEAWMDRLDDFLDRELTPEEMHRVQAHLDTCGACTGQFQLERDSARPA